MCLNNIYELGSKLCELLSTLKKNREYVPLEILQTQYRVPYETLPLESTFFFDIMKANGGITYMSIQSDIEMLSIEALEHLVFESRKDM